MSDRKVRINKEKCKSCLYCVEFCPKKSIALTKSTNARGFYYVEFTDTDNKCTSCAICATMCPEACIEVYKPGNSK